MKPLFVLRNIAAVNFYLYGQDFPIDSLGNTVFLGGNSSGKSVLLDAIQIVMTGTNKRYLDLNSRVSEGGKNRRTVLEACLGLLDDGEGYERQACLTYIALGFEASDGSRRCTAGICLEAKASLNEETVLGLFIVDDFILRFNDFVHVIEGGFEEKAWQSFLDEQRRKGHSVHIYQRQNNKAFLRQLYSIINANARGTQLDPDRARAAIRQALSFDIEQITSVTEFVKRFLLDEAAIEIETFQARYATWRSLQKDIARVEAEIRTVETIRSQCERVMEEQFNARFWVYGTQRAEYDRYTSLITRQEQEIAEMRKGLTSIEAYKTTLSANVEGSRFHLDAVVKQISGTPAYEQIKHGRSEKERHGAIRRTASIEARVVFDALKALHEVGASPSFPSRNFPAIQSFTQSRLSQTDIGNYDSGWPASPKKIVDVVSAVPPLSEARAHIESLYQKATAANARLAQELEDIERQLKNLRSGGTFMSKDTQAFLADMARIKVPAQSLSELADIAPGFAEWRGIIEAILGDWCDAVLVEPRFMDHAYGHFDSHYKATRTKLVQSENKSSDEGIRTGTLAEAVTTENGYARAFLNVRLGRILRARLARDIREGDLAASIDGKYAHGRGIEYRRLPSIPRLGKSIRDQQIAQLMRNKQSVEPQLRTARDYESRLFALVEALKRADASLITERESALANLQNISNADVEIERQAELIARLESTLPEGLLSEKSKRENELKIFQNQLNTEVAKEKKLIEEIGDRKGAMGTNIKERTKYAQQALEVFPVREQRLQRHDPPIGLECFVERARAGYRKVVTAQSDPAQVRNHFDTLLKEKRQSRGGAMRLAGSISEYVQANPDQHPGSEWTVVIESERTTKLYDWISLRHRHLTETVLRNFTLQVDKAVLALVETMVHDFLSRLRANIDAVERVKDDLNRRLRGSVFMGEVYQIRQERDQDKETIRYLIDRLDIVAPKATALMQSNTDPNDPDQVKIKQLIEMLTFEGGDEAAHRRHLHELADYRSYFRFSIDICDPENGYRKISDLEQRRGKASGGQKFVPFYICLGVAAASAYHNHLGDSGDAPPQSALLLMDEAFEKLDPENIYKVISFYKGLGLQLIMAAPKTHQALYQETFNTLISIVRVGRAVKATAQHFHPAAHDLLRAGNPMHRPRSYFENRVRQEHEDATK
jgi:hypothetical protein